MDHTELLGRQVIDTLPEKSFVKVLREFDESAEINLSDAIVGCAGVTLYPIGSTHYIVHAKAGWSYFESATETAWRAHVDAWADFARGYWSKCVPTTPGTYAVRNRAGHRCRDHVLITVGGVLKDVDSGYLPAGVVSLWAGDFWSVAYPPLPGAL